ncbi:DUF2764 family protein [Candidatus Protochlamydia phocaeensis]|uniref:DUF2764 family protein n=1 Tax=Candidatus Protochlamydia phocaeensis TaxID=1414722 RepID=UPI000839774B|nr:DUF2764 family protein [Candidatus Protochlamydia phocaeensis]
MAKYYYVGTYLPPLSFDSPPDITFAEFDTLIRDNLTKRDYEKTKVIRAYYDILNLRSLWLREELDPRGELDRLELEEALVNHVGLPDYVYDFIAAHEKAEERVRHFPFLLAKFFQSAAEETDPFLREYLNFERELRLVWTGYRAKKLGRDLSVELQYEDPEEDLIAQLLAQKDAKVFEPPEKYQELKVMFEKYGDDPLALQQALDQYRVAYIEGMVDMADAFSIERILAYMAQLIIIEKWFELDKNKGKEIVDTIVKEK